MTMFAEPSTLSALMLSEAARAKWLPRMVPEMFSDAAHAEEFKALRYLHQHGHPVSPETVFERLTATIGARRSAPYLDHLREIADLCPGPNQAEAEANRCVPAVGRAWATRIDDQTGKEWRSLVRCGYSPDQLANQEDNAERRIMHAVEVRPPAPPEPSDEAIAELDEGDTDLAAANRFVKMFGHNIRFCPEKNRWYVWVNTHWRHDDGASIVTRLAAQSARRHSISCIAKDIAALRAARKLENDTRIRGSVRLASALESVRVELAQLDAVPHLLNFMNGTVDLRTAEILPHSREHLITHLIEVMYNPKSGCPRFHRFLGEIHPGQPEVTDFVHRWIGYCLTGEIREHKFIVAVGDGRNGKGTLFETIALFLGPQLAFQAPRSLLMHRKYDGHPAEFNALRGKRLVLVSEVDGGQSFGAERVKWLTGGDSITARGMNENFSTFMPTHKFCMYVNELPAATDSSVAFWERVRVVTFNESFVGERKDPELKPKLAAEAEGIMAWAVAGAVSWYANGLPEVSEVNLASLAYQNESDDVKRWLEDILLDGTMGREQTAKFFSDSYAEWAKRNGGRDFSMKALASELKRHKATKRRTKYGAEWTLPSLEDLIGTVTGDGCDGFSDSSLVRGAHDSTDQNTRHHPSPVTTGALDEEDILPF